MSSSNKMSSGYDANLPLRVDNVDMFYTLSKTLKDNIKQNIKMLFLTSPGERMMVPQYGVGLRNFLFEQDPAQDLVERIYSQVAVFLPEITILKLDVNRGDRLTEKKTGQGNTLVVSFFYEITGTNVRDALILTDEMIS